LAVLARGCRTARRPVFPVTFSGTRADAVLLGRRPLGK
jgi:hypothetical protein